MQWDIFCRVIDNFGDLGVCWRLCADLGARGHAVRLWVDDPAGLHWMAPGAAEGRWPLVTVLDWEQSKDVALLASLPPADVWIEAFGCDIATEFIAFSAQPPASAATQPNKPPIWINLEYLSAESYVERSHGLTSPILRGPAAGWTKYFFYPGFTANTGGLLREPGLQLRQQAFEAGKQRAGWLAGLGIDWAGEALVSLFCYEPPALQALLAQLDAKPSPVRLLVTAGRAQAAVRAALASLTEQSAPGAAPSGLHNLRLSYLPSLTQTDFDHLLWSCDLNFVRGEDSLVRALWAGKPLVWQIYPQQDQAHVPKLNAFLQAIKADANLRAFHQVWNSTQPPAESGALPLPDLAGWSKTVQSARQALLQSGDLLTQLLQFILKKQ